MSETLQIIVGIILLVGVYILTQMVVGYRISVPPKILPGNSTSKRPMMMHRPLICPMQDQHVRIGLRDFRPKAINVMVQGGLWASRRRKILPEKATA